MFIHIFVFMSLDQSISLSKFDSEQEKLMINVIYSANLLNLITSRLFKPYELSPGFKFPVPNQQSSSIGFANIIF